jgi:hypothetical protein
MLIYVKEAGRRGEKGKPRRRLEGTVEKRRDSFLSAVVVVDHGFRRLVEAVELAVIHGPPEGGADEKYQHDGERDEEQQDFHA